MVLLGGPAAKVPHTLPGLHLGLQLLVRHRAEQPELPVLWRMLCVIVLLSELFLHADNCHELVIKQNSSGPAKAQHMTQRGMFVAYLCEGAEVHRAWLAVKCQRRNAAVAELLCCARTGRRVVVLSCMLLRGHGMLAFTQVCTGTVVPCKGFWHACSIPKPCPGCAIHV